MGGGITYCATTGPVAYFDVTVYDAAVVNVLHGAGELPHESARVLLRQLAVCHDVVLHADGGCRARGDVLTDHARHFNPGSAGRVSL